MYLVCLSTFLFSFAITLFSIHLHIILFVSPTCDFFDFTCPSQTVVKLLRAGLSLLYPGISKSQDSVLPRVSDH